MDLFDSSALLRFLQGEHGAEVVEVALAENPRCSAVNWSETARKANARSGEWNLARGLLLSYGVVVEPVVIEDAERAAAAWPGRRLVPGRPTLSRYRGAHPGDDLDG